MKSIRNHFSSNTKGVGPFDGIKERGTSLAEKAVAIAFSAKVVADDGAGIIDARNGRAGARGLQGVGVVDDGVGSVGIEEKTVRDGSSVREISGDRSA